MNKKIKILYLEYVSGDAALADNIINQAGIDCEVLTVSNGEAYLDGLKNFAPDIIISDDALRSLNSIEALTLLKQSGFNIPVVVVATPPLIDPIASIVNIMKYGASDYISKEQIDILPGAILGAIKKHKAKKIDGYDLSRNTDDEVYFSRDIAGSKMIQISTGCESIYGYSSAEFLSDPDLYAKVCRPEDSAMLADFVKRLRNGDHVTGKYRIIHKDKSIRWIESKISPIHNEEGILIRIDGVSRNITQDKIVEEALKASESRYRQIVETAQEGIWIIDENLLTVFVNKKMCDMLGYTAEEIVGKHNYDFKDEKEKLATLARFEKQQLGITETHESAFITKSGEQIFCLVVTNGLFDTDGKYLGKLGMLTA
ncbi:PAS domain S-box protein [Mucilaginibacter sp.]|uniref:PAS domain S-box protein n=1 Tax=Mucilaginibacter sp. TaxID=1882438 RepID=UPI0025CD30FA|nr:PAS domain S-box protein [Mucilaginibacter sp.]